MPGAFEIGDRVQLLDDALEGRVTAVAGNTIFFRSADGFEFEVNATEIIRLPEEASRAHRLGAADVAPKDSDKAPGSGPAKSGNYKTRQGTRSRKGKAPPVVVDLHAEKIFPKHRFPDTYEILERQLEEAQRMLEFALRKRIQHLVFIHGVGAGVLKAELETLLRRYPEIIFNQADFRTYGQGALAVYIPQSSFS